jgi:hypothetical protein
LTLAGVVSLAASGCGGLLVYADEYQTVGAAGGGGGSNDSAGASGVAGAASSAAGVGGSGSGAAGDAAAAGTSAGGSGGSGQGGADAGGSGGTDAGNGGGAGAAGSAGVGGNTGAGFAGTGGAAVAGAGGTDTTKPGLKVTSLGTYKGCSGGELQVNYLATGAFGAGYQIVAELSQPDGSFPGAIVGVTAGAASGSVTALIPAETKAGTTYEVRLKATDPELVSEPFSLPLTVLRAKVPEIVADRYYALEGEKVTFSVKSNAYTSYTWDFGAASTPVSGAGQSASTAFGAAGGAVVKVTVTDGNGCRATGSVGPESDGFCEAFLGCVSVFSCSPNLAAMGPWGESPLRLCDGKTLSDGGGGVIAFVETGAVLHFTGGGSWTSYVKSGATYTGASGGSSVVITEPGSNVSGPADATLECPKLTFTGTSACK